MSSPLRRLPQHKLGKSGLILPSEESHTFREIKDSVMNLLQEVETMPAGRHRDQIMQAIEDVTNDGDIEKLYEVTKWRRTPVDLDEFMFSSVYLGLRPSEIYPGVIEDLRALDSGQYVEAVLKGAVGGGKTTVANLGTLRQLYFISCLRTPQATFGVQRNSSIVFTIQSVRLSTAKKAVFQEMGAYIANSPYFTEVYPYDHRISSEMIFREQRVTIMPVSSSDTGAISMNVIGGLLDEMNFMERIKKSKRDDIDTQGDYDQAKNLYLNLSKRRRSRFMTRGKLPGILFLVSSSRYPDDFTETKAMEASMLGGNDPAIYVASRSLWEAKGRERFSDKIFRVAIGNENRRSEILPDSSTPPLGMDIIEVPDDLRIEFEKDIDGSIRDLAGRTTLATHPFIRNRESIHECLRRSDEFGYRNIFELETYDLSVAVPRPIEENIRTDVDQMRVAHVDLATTGDAAGLSVGHVAGMRTVQRVNPYTSEITSETLPVVGIDFAMRIIPPQNGEIDFSKIRQIIFMLREEYGLPIKILTADGFNCISGDTQIWTTRGLVRADNVKVGDIVQSRVGARPIKKVWNYGIHKALQIVTKDGHSITVTDNHKLEVPRWSRSRLPLLTNGDGWKWQKASKFHVGDILHTWDGPTEVDVLNYDGPLTEDLACLYGMIYGDGNLQKDGVSISCHSTEIADCGAFVRRVVDARCTSLFYDGPNRGRVQFSSRSFVKHMKELGFDKKGLPNVLLEAPKRIQAAFLRGLFSTDGSVKRRDGQVSLSTKHKWVADYVRNFLRMAYGLATHTTITNPSKYDGSYINGYHVWSSSKKHYIVSVRGSRKNFLDNIGFVYSIKTISMEKHRKVKGRRIGSSIVSIKEVDATVFDFEVEDDHSYLANGFVSHNSVDFKQIMGKKGYVTDYLSLDRTTGPYVSFKNAMQDNRVLLPRSNILVKELVELEYTRNGAKEKVDHPARGSKDVSDAVCGVVSTLLTRRSAWVGRPRFMGTGGFMMHGNRTVQPNVYLPTAEDIEKLEASPRKKTLPRRSVDRKSREDQ